MTVSFEHVLGELNFRSSSGSTFRTRPLLPVRTLEKESNDDEENDTRKQPVQDNMNCNETRENETMSDKTQDNKRNDDDDNDDDEEVDVTNGCSICYDPKTTMITLTRCKHAFCRLCLQTWLHQRQSLSEASRINNVTPSLGSPLNEYCCPQCRQIIDGHDIEREQLLVLPVATTLLHPTQDTIVGELEDVVDSGTANEEEEDDIEALTMDWLRENGAVQCGNCRSWIVREDGCDAMICLCGFRFCWTCAAYGNALKDDDDDSDNDSDNDSADNDSADNDSDDDDDSWSGRPRTPGSCRCGHCPADYHDNILRREGLDLDDDDAQGLVATADDFSNFRDFMERYREEVEERELHNF